MFSGLIMVSFVFLYYFSYTVLAGPLFDRAQSSLGRLGCGSEIADEDVQVAEKEFQVRLATLKSNTSDAAELRLIEVDVYWHIVAANATLQGGWIPNEQIDAQMEVPNQDYTEVGITWRHASTTRIISANWFEGITQDSADANTLKRLFRKEGANVLNVYTVGFPGSSLLGYSTFPWSYGVASSLDGIIILYSTLPGGSTPNHNLGRTLTHEAGHWLGLYHTFQGACIGKGDLVDDTPAVRAPNFGCPTQRDSCTGGGVDMISNFMDYTDDACKKGFTPGQISRLQLATLAYRGL